jgi:hypothetical protein
MFESDYIMRMILQLVRVLRRSLARQFPSREAEIKDIEGSIAEAVDLDPRLMFTLSPESLVSVLELGNFDTQLAGYVVRSIYYESDLLERDGQAAKAQLRRQQADAIAARFGVQVEPADLGPAGLENFLAEQESDQQGLR